MNLPRSPVLRLTFWYVLIIMTISITFSAVIYTQTTHQFRVGFVPEPQMLRHVDPRFSPLFEQRIADLLSERYESVMDGLRLQLILVNVAILCGAGLVSYLLAKRTLKPIEDALDEQRRFVADASHELRTPLTAMKMEIEVALRGADSGEHTRVLGSALEEIGKLEGLSNSLLQLARHENEQQHPTMKTVEFEPMIEEAVQRVQGAASLKQIALERENLSGIVLGDQASLVNLFSTLLDNAIKYSPIKSKVRLAGTWTPKQLTIAVADQGAGIPASDLPHVFRRFFRSVTSRSKKDADGFGLGLSIAKQIVDRHHGTIDIKSAVGKGTTVTINLPRPV